MRAYTIEEGSLRRLQTMLRWFESTAHLRDLTPSARYVFDEDGDPRCWDIAELKSDHIKLTRCHFMRGPVTVWGAADLTCALTGSGDVTVAAKIDTEDHSVTLVAGGTGTAWDATVNESSKYYLLPRYVLNRAAETGGWSVKVDCRDIPQLAVYV